MQIKFKAVRSTAEGVEDARVQFRNGVGAAADGRYVGWKHVGNGKYELIEDGETVEVTQVNRNDYIRAVRRKELEILEGEF